ncbi:MAG: acyl carrier protein [Deltaproteobacteria bacterium]|nr:acyl carrier protein [Deltaproteobacteria bacterium]
MTTEIQSDDVYAKIKEVIAEVFSIDEDGLSMETKIIDDLGAESLDIITLLMEFEDAFDRQIPEEDAEKLLTIGDAVNYIMDMGNKPE